MSEWNADESGQQEGWRKDAGYGWSGPAIWFVWTIDRMPGSEDGGPMLMLGVEEPEEGRQVVEDHSMYKKSQCSHYAHTTSLSLQPLPVLLSRGRHIRNHPSIPLQHALRLVTSCHLP